MHKLYSVQTMRRSTAQYPSHKTTPQFLYNIVCVLLKASPVCTQVTVVFLLAADRETPQLDQDKERTQSQETTEKSAEATTEKTLRPSFKKSLSSQEDEDETQAIAGLKYSYHLLHLTLLYLPLLTLFVLCQLITCT